MLLDLKKNEYPFNKEKEAPIDFCLFFPTFNQKKLN